MTARAQTDLTPRVLPSRRLMRLTSWVGGCILTLILALAFFPKLFAPYDATKRVALPLQKPSADFLLGTNDIGQDLMSELIAGTRVSLFTGLIVSFISVLVGTIIGIASGYLGGWANSLLMRLTDLILVLPFLPLVILISVYLGPSQKNVILVLVIFFWAAPARLIRSRILSLRTETYIEAARALGANSFHIMASHLWSGVKIVGIGANCFGCICIYSGRIQFEFFRTWQPIRKKLGHHALLRACQRGLSSATRGNGGCSRQA